MSLSSRYLSMGFIEVLDEFLDLAMVGVPVQPAGRDSTVNVIRLVRGRKNELCCMHCDTHRLLRQR